MKTKGLFAALFALLTITFTSCDKSDMNDGQGEPIAILNVATDGVSSFATKSILTVLSVTSPLTADDIEFLFAVREDEKLARDLVTVFSNQYPASLQFANIVKAEATHIVAIEAFLDYYEIEYPALEAPGVFIDAARQAKYNDLSAKGTTLLEACKTMASFEEEGIVAYKAASSDAANANIKLIIDNMLRSSTNHFKAYIRQITALGETYTPILDETTYNDIVNSPFGQGNKYGQQNGKGQGNVNTNSGKGGQGQGKKGSVNGSGDCTGTSNGNTPGTGKGKGYRGGR